MANLSCFTWLLDPKSTRSQKAGRGSRGPLKGYVQDEVSITATGFTGPAQFPEGKCILPLDGEGLKKKIVYGHLYSATLSSQAHSKKDMQMPTLTTVFGPDLKSALKGMWPTVLVWSEAPYK